jgi:four helix bundle protein
MTPGELKERTKQFALRVFKVAESLPRTEPGRVVCHQLVRSGSAVAANYRAACRARSHADFISKIPVVEEEADETAFWLELIEDAGMLPSDKLKSVRAEADELTAILAASHISATKTQPWHNPQSTIINSPLSHPDQQSSIRNQQ